MRAVWRAVPAPSPIASNDPDRVLTLRGGLVAWNQAGYPMKWWDE